ncbi:response regulator [Eubacteriaceae bacterium ES3]|nr:response regulator [Eubacteriaceae bacterium ES3]
MVESNQTFIRNNSKILIVDDLESNAFLLEQLLKVNGFINIKKITNSQEAVDTYLEYKPDLLLLDLKMPKPDGFEILKQLDSLKKDDYVSVIVITAQNDQHNRLKALKAGAKDFIGKPFDHAEVIMRVTNHLDIRILHNQIQENNRLLERRVRERTAEIENLQFELVDKLLMAAEFRDDDTGYHVIRLGKYTEAMARLLNYDEHDIYRLTSASMMHDIGKIAISDDILLKPGRLTPDEMLIMKKHAERGATILSESQSDILALGEIIALTHHEKWDGSGYPAGLKGEEIPISGRITSLFDVFDALLSKRPYKDAWELDKVLNLLKQESGFHFDPQLVELFFENLDVFLAIHNRFSE